MTRSILRTLAALALAAAVPGAGYAQSLSPSVPAVSTPLPGTPSLSAASIQDLNTAPPVASAAIVDLVKLGVYPLEDGSLANPNEPVTEQTLAFMMLNLLTPGITGEYPVDGQSAASYLDVVSQGALTGEPGDTVSAQTYLTLLVALVDLTPDEAAAVRAALEERYPALRSGNPDAPLTRAGAALLLWQTLAVLRGS
jgi:hypothetical protein